MALVFTLAGVDRTSAVKTSGLSISDTLNSRNTCYFQVIDKAGTMLFPAGTSVVITNNGTRVFAGTVETFKREDLTPETGTGILHTLNCLDYNQIMDRFEVAASFANQTCGAIIASLAAQYLVGEGITLANVQAGPVIVSATWNYVPLATALQELADMAGFSWWVDYNKVLNFQPRDGITAAFALADTSANFRKLTVTQSRTNYRNQQFVRAGFDLANSQTFNAVGDGKTRAFLYPLAVGAAPGLGVGAITSVTVNGAAKTFGIQSVDTGKDFYYQVGSATLTQDTSGTLLTAADTVAWTYQGQIPIIVNAQIDSEIATRAAVEGDTGIYQGVEYYPNVNSSTSAQQIATSLLAKLGMIPTVVNYETDQDGLFSGSLQTITNTRYGLSGTYLISKVTARDFTGKGNLRYTVEAQDGQFLGGWEAFFRAIAAIGKTYVIRQNEVVVYLRTAGKLTGVGARALESLAAGWVDPANANVGATATMAAPTSMTPESRVDFALTDLSETG